MAYIYAKINKNTLKFIREQRKISYDYIYKKTKFPKEKIETWEDLEKNKYPTINQAKQLAECYHVPFAGLYMNAKDINTTHLPMFKNFRRFTNSIDDESSMNLAIIDVMLARDFFIEAKKQLKEELPSLNVHINTIDVVTFAKNLHEYLNIDINKQFRFNSRRQFFLYLRQLIEKKGVFVQGFSGVNLEVMRGFAVYDPFLPIIGINNTDRYPAKSFSMIHELVHIIQRTSSMCDDMFSSNIKEEVFCNAIAGEVLVPTNILKKIYSDISEVDLITLDDIAQHFSVSAEVIARKFLDCGICSPVWYRSTTQKLAERLEKQKQEERATRKLLGKGIPRNMAREAIDKTSTEMCSILGKGYINGIFDKKDVAGYIGIKEKHIEKFIGEVLKWNI